MVSLPNLGVRNRAEVFYYFSSLPRTRCILNEMTNTVCIYGHECFHPLVKRKVFIFFLTIFFIHSLIQWRTCVFELTEIPSLCLQSTGITGVRHDRLMDLMVWRNCARLDKVELQRQLRGQTSKKQKPTEVPERGLDQPWHLERLLSNLLAELSAGCAVCSRLAALSRHPCWGRIGDAVV